MAAFLVAIVATFGRLAGGFRHMDENMQRMQSQSDPCNI
jgi:hypothetical protein